MLSPKAYAADSVTRPMDRSERKAAWTDAAAVELEDELVETALEMFPSQAVVDAERPGLQVGEDAMDHGSTIWAAMLPTTWGSWATLGAPG